MAENSKIEWTNHTANFWWGCLKVSPGCEHCYADTWASRWGKDIWGPVATTDREPKKSVWSNVRKWNREAKESGHRKKVFCMSMGDFFEDHPQVTDIRDKALALIQTTPYLDWQILTKRPENVIPMLESSHIMNNFSSVAEWFNTLPNVWIGTSVENQEQANKRIPELLKIPASVRFLSMEPLLGPVDLHSTMEDGGSWGAIGGQFCHKCEEFSWYDEDGDVCPKCYQTSWTTHARVDWVIVGGESGHNARPMRPDWVRSIRDQCVAAGVAFHFKQWGEFRPNEFVSEVSGESFCTYSKVGKKAAGRLLDGREWNEFPQTERA